MSVFLSTSNNEGDITRQQIKKTGMGSGVILLDFETFNEGTLVSTMEDASPPGKCFISRPASSESETQIQLQQLPSRLLALISLIHFSR